MRSIPNALVVLFVSVLMAGCGEPSDLVTAGEDSDYAVVVTPSTARLEEVGATQAFTAAVFSNGLPVDVDPQWSSADFTVVTVGTDGVAVARGAGQTFVIASVENAADSAVVTVDFVSTGAPSS